jgi:hypothetical protein
MIVFICIYRGMLPPANFRQPSGLMICATFRLMRWLPNESNLSQSLNNNKRKIG